MINRVVEVQRRTGQLPGVQYLRALAALMVVVHHALNSYPGIFAPPDYPAFAFGVDIFFVISGFIMVVAASSETPGSFAVRRLIRIVPLYWAATLALLVKNQKLQLFDLSGETARHLGLSLVFWPHYSPEHPGQIWPYLVPGWTLTFELFFYAVFTLGLLWRRPLLTVSVLLPVLVVVGWLTQPQDAVLRTFTDPQLLTFTVGAWLGVLHRRVDLPTWLVVLVPVGLAGLLLSPEVTHGQFWLRLVSALGVVVGGVALGARPLPRLGVVLGDASYSIYLTHLLLPIPLAGRVAEALPVPRGPQLAIAIVLALVVSSAVGWLVYRFGEQPTLRVLRARLLPRRPPRTDGATLAPGPR